MRTDRGPILIVEDILSVRELLEVTLRFKGYKVISARDGVDALEKIKSFHPVLILPSGGKAKQAYWLDKVENLQPVLVITDILMPRMDGFAFVHNLRLNPETRNVPVIFLTAQYTSQEDKNFGMSLGATRFIEKPIDIEDFILTIAEILAQDVVTQPTTLNTRDFYNGYRERLEHKLRQKNNQISRAESLLVTLPEEQHAAFTIMLKQALNDRDAIQADLKEVRRALDELESKETNRD